MPFIIEGTPFDDELRGTQSDDEISGFGGDDLIKGRGGDDVLFGDGGDDDLIGGSGVNDYIGGRGYDSFIMSGRDASFSDDLIVDFDFASDQIDVSQWGISDFSQIKALLFADSSDSATVNAYYDGRNHWLTIDGVFPSELRSIDFLYSDSGAKNQNGTGYGDVLFGSRFGDTLNGRGSHDQLLGGNGNDNLIGDKGNDDLFGGLGADLLTGGAGYDNFVYAKVSESRPGADRDRISGFQTVADLIDLSDIDARAGVGGNQAFVWRGDAGLTGSGQLTYSFSGNNTFISGSVDRDAAAEFQILLTGGRFNLDADDFVL